MPAGPTPKIVLSYRRSDSAMAGRIFDRLAQHFGKSNLFIDDNVPFGVDFRKQIDDALQASDVLVALVGEKWLGPQAGGKLRIMNDADPVRVELETALKRNVTVLPVLLDGTSMPDPADLPEGIRDFAYRNAIEVESGRGPDWTRRLAQFDDKTTDTIYYMGTDDPLVRIRESYVEGRKPNGKCDWK